MSSIGQQNQPLDADDGPNPGGGMTAAVVDPERVRFSGIVEKPRGVLTGEALDGVIPIRPNERHWNMMSRQVWQISRLTAIFVFFSIMVGLPLGNYLAHQQLYGTATGWSIFEAYPFDVLMFAFIVPVLIVLCGYILSRAFTMMTAAESIAAAAQRMVTPEGTAIQNVNSVGAVVQGHVNALNDGIDGALARLASVEAMIRQHVEAIEIAGEAIEHKAAGAVGRVANERSRLMELTETLNTHADSFAVAIAERANSSIEALNKADDLSLRVEQDFDERLSRLESAAQKALGSFENLRDALRDTEHSIRATAGKVGEATELTLSATEKAKVVSNAAAESAARNAANAIAAATHAGAGAQKAADEAIKSVTKETARLSEAAVKTAKLESEKIKDAASQTLVDVTEATRSVIDGAAAEAARASKAAADVTEAARRTSEAAAKASADVSMASEQAKKTAEEAAQYSQVAADKTEQRNKALAAARADLEQENERLETLIEEQRKRADRLADAIATQTERLSRLAEAQLREQEAAARIAEAQNEMQIREEAKHAEEKKTTEARRRENETKKAETERAMALEAEKFAKAEQQKRDSERRTPNAKKTEPTLTRAKDSAAAAPKKNGAGRLDELAQDIAQRRTPKEPLAGVEPISLGDQDKRAAKPADPQRDKKQISWKEILDATDIADPIDLARESRDGIKPAASGNGKSAPASDEEAARAIKIIARLQGFTYELETRLYGDAPPALRERFERGDRNVFANRLLRLNEADVKRRIRTESGRDKKFEHGIHDFLQGFETLLEDATTSETADEELEQYLSSPLGRVYLLIGATVGYFA